MAFNLFQNILDKANYLKSGQLGSDFYNATRNEDPTQNIQYKVAQGGANLYTGIKSRLQETAQSDIEKNQEVADNEGREFAKHLATKGYSKEQIFSALDTLQAEGKLTAKPNLAERIVGGLGQRMETIQMGTERLAGEQNMAKRLGFGGAFYAGNVVATPFEPVGATLQPVVEPIMKPAIESKLGQATIRKAQEFDEKYPIASLGLQGVGNISQLAPIPFAKPLANVATKGAKGAVNVAKPLIKKVTPNLGTTSAKLTRSADMGFRKQAEEIALPKLDEMGIRERGKVAGDVIETKPGFFKKEELVRSPQEALAIEEVSRMLKEGKIKKGTSEIAKSEAIDGEIGTLAKQLKENLKANPTKISQSEVMSFVDDLAMKIEDNPIIVGSTRESADKILRQIKKGLTKNEYTLAEVLEMRQKLDADIKAFKGDKAFDPEIENAFSSVLKDFRQGLNNKVAEMAPDVNVRQLLDRQSALYIARDTVESRWAKQATTTIGQILSKIQKTTGIPRTEIIELSTALGLAGVFTPFVAPVAGAITASTLGRAGIRRVLSPQNKLRVANLLKKVDSALKKTPNDAELLKVKKVFSNPQSYGGTTPDIWNSSNAGGTPNKVNPKPLSNESKVSKPLSSTNSNSVNSKVSKKLPTLDERKSDFLEKIKKATAEEKKQALESLIFKQKVRKASGEELSDLQKFQLKTLSANTETVKKPLKKEVKTTKQDYISMLDEAKKNLSLATTDKAKSGFRKQIKFFEEQIANTEIPGGYTKNMFGEIIKKPSNSKGGFIRLPGAKKLSSPADKSPDKALVEEARKYPDKRSFELAIYGNRSQKPQIKGQNHFMIDDILDNIDTRPDTRTFDLGGGFGKDSPSAIKYFSVENMPNQSIYFPDGVPEYVTIYRGGKKGAKKLSSLREGEYATIDKGVARKYAGYEGEIKEFKVKTKDLIFDPRENGELGQFNVIFDSKKRLNVLEKYLGGNAGKIYEQAHRKNSTK